MPDTTIILGAGTTHGIGGQLAQKFSDEGHHVIVAGRSPEKIESVAANIRGMDGSAEAFQTDVTSADDLDALFAHADARGSLGAVIYNAGNNAIIPFKDLTPEDFEAYWRVSCFGAFLTAKRALSSLTAQGKGSLFFTGASASLRGRPNFAHFASAKAAMRALAQSLAREFGPQGIHVAHFVIDGIVDADTTRPRFGDHMDSLGDDGVLNPARIADAYWAVHAQHRSAWTHELDLRPYSETW